MFDANLYPQTEAAFTLADAFDGKVSIDEGIPSRISMPTGPDAEVAGDLLGIDRCEDGTHVRIHLTNGVMVGAGGDEADFDEMAFTIAGDTVVGLHDD